MTRAEILDCLTDRPCDSCKFHESGKCERWDCVFEERAEEQADDAIGMTKEELARFINDTKDKWHFTTESGKEVSAEQMLKTLSAEPCEDAISRQAALDVIAETDITNGTEPVFTGKQVQALLRDLPLVTPKQKMGHWINYQKNIWIYAQCSECGTVHDTQTNYCPNCGAKMAGSEGNE